MPDKRGVLEVKTVNGKLGTDAISFPEADIDHTRLSVPGNGVKSIEFDCNHVEVNIYRGGVTELIITKKGTDGTAIKTEICLYPQTEYVLSRRVSKS